jgi:hypothetical protein
MSFTDRLLLWLHVGFAVFTLGPVAAAMMATPRYIRKRDLAVLRYLYRTTRIFGVLTVGVFLFGLLLGRHDFNQAWFSAAMTLFIVAAVLMVLVARDQHRAIVAIEKMAAAGDAGKAVEPVPANSASASPVPADAGGASAEGTMSAATEADEISGASGASQAGDSGAPAGTVAPAHVASVERGRIASLAGLISAIWLVILVLMVWHGQG